MPEAGTENRGEQATNLGTADLETADLGTADLRIADLRMAGLGTATPFATKGRTPCKTALQRHPLADLVPTGAVRPARAKLPKLRRPSPAGLSRLVDESPVTPLALSMTRILAPMAPLRIDPAQIFGSRGAARRL